MTRLDGASDGTVVDKGRLLAASVLHVHVDRVVTGIARILPCLELSHSRDEAACGFSVTAF